MQTRAFLGEHHDTITKQIKIEIMKILIISDTHSYLDEKLFKYIQTVDEVWHAGDIGTISLCDEISKLKPLRAV